MSDPLALAVDQVKLAEERRRAAFAVGDRGPLPTGPNAATRFFIGETVFHVDTGMNARIERYRGITANGYSTVEITLDNGDRQIVRGDSLEKVRPTTIANAVR
jgi:hypothetical protein